MIILGLEPDVHTYTNMINAYVRCNDTINAEKMFEEMIRY